MQNGQCYECQYKERKNEIGKNKEAYKLALTGITIVVSICDTCGKEVGILPKRDMDLAINESNNEKR